MAKTSLKVKQKRNPKFSSRQYNRCNICGRSRGYIRKFDLCRICFRELAGNLLLPGVYKASW